MYAVNRSIQILTGIRRSVLETHKKVKHRINSDFIAQRKTPELKLVKIKSRK